MRVEVAERVRAVEVDRPRVVLVEDPHLAVVDASAESPSGPSVGDDRADGHHAQAVDGRAARSFFVSHEFGEPEPRQLAFDEVERVVGQDDGRVLGDVVAQEVAVEVVVVQVRDVEVVGAAERRPVEPWLRRERHPGGEVGGIEPRVAEDRAVACLDEESSVTEECDPHGRLSFEKSVMMLLAMLPDIADTGMIPFWDATRESQFDHALSRSVSDAGRRASSGDGPHPMNGRLKPRLKGPRPRSPLSRVCRDLGEEWKRRVRWVMGRVRGGE